MATSVPERWLDPSGWYRVGRGRSFAFDLPTTSVVEVIERTLSRLDDRVDLLTCEVEKVGRQYFSTFRIDPVKSLTADGPWNHFLRSQRLTPAIPAPHRVPNGGPNWPATFAANGLISLMHPDPRGWAGPKGRARTESGDATPLSSLGIVQRVASGSSDEVIEHAEYDKLFGALRRAVRAASRQQAS
jgi:hypothetical protein